MLYKVLPDLQSKYLRIKTNLLLFRFFDSKVLLAGEHKSRSHLQYFLKNFDHRKKIHWNSFRLLQIHMLLWAEFQFNFRLELLLGFRYLLLLSQNSDRKYFNFAKEVHVRRLESAAHLSKRGGWNKSKYLKGFVTGRLASVLNKSVGVQKLQNQLEFFHQFLC